MLVLISASLARFLFVSCGRGSTETAAGHRGLLMAPAHCSCANMVEMRSVTEPGTDTHRWLGVIEGCPLSVAWPQQLRNTDGNR